MGLGLFSWFVLFACMATGAAAAVASDRALRSAALVTVPEATFEEQIAELVNQERASCATSACPLPPLKLVSILTRLADDHTSAMAVADFFSHCDFTTGLDPFERMIGAGYSYATAAENIAAGSSTPAAVMAQWMGSAIHRANILGDGFREQGAGYFYQSGDLSNIDYDRNSDCDCADAGESCNYAAQFHYWTQMFGLRNPVYPLVIEREKHETSTGAVELYVFGPATALEMRFSNDGGNWSAWQAYSPNAAWSLAGGDGLRTVFSEVRNATSVYRACDRIWRTGDGGSQLFTDSFECDGAGAWSPPAP